TVSAGKVLPALAVGFALNGVKPQAAAVAAIVLQAGACERADIKILLIDDLKNRVIEIFHAGVKARFKRQCAEVGGGFIGQARKGVIALLIEGDVAGG